MVFILTTFIRKMTEFMGCMKVLLYLNVFVAFREAEEKELNNLNFGYACCKFLYPNYLIVAWPARQLLFLQFGQVPIVDQNFLCCYN